METKHIIAYDMSGTVLLKAQDAHNNKKKTYIFRKIYYFVGYDMHHEIYRGVKKIVPSILKMDEAYRNVF